MGYGYYLTRRLRGRAVPSECEGVCRPGRVDAAGGNGYDPGANS